LITGRGGGGGSPYPPSKKKEKEGVNTSYPRKKGKKEALRLQYRRPKKKKRGERGGEISHARVSKRKAPDCVKGRDLAEKKLSGR